MTPAGIVAWSPADGPPGRGRRDGKLAGDGKLGILVGGRLVPLAMDDDAAAALLAALDVSPDVAAPAIRHPNGGIMRLT